MSEIPPYMASSRRRLFVLVLSFAVLASLWACSFDAPGGKEVIVAAETIRLRSSTAEAARTVGELKIGERATIKEQEDEGSTTWVRIVGPNDQKGWTEMSNLLEVGTAEKSRKLAEEIRNIQTQAVGRSRASLKLRLTPDRSNEDNVLVLLPSGTLLDIVGRDRKPRPEKTDQKEGDESAQAGQSGQTAQTSPSPKAGQTAPRGQNGQSSQTGQNVRYDDWLNVRLPSNPVTPAGWIYGGSVELEIPGEIVYYASTGRRVVGWVKIGENSADNQTDAPYLVLERQLFGPEGSADFDRIKVLVWDPARRDYYTALREDVKGRFPVEATVNGRAGTFAIPAASGKLVYDFAIPADGKAKAKRREEPKERLR